MDDARSLQEAIGEGGIEAVHFFNGRLLSGQDLSREQAAQRRARERLGLALGTGIVFGLEVSRVAATSENPLPGVRVEAGLAINAEGEALRLEEPETIRLTRVAQPTPSGPEGFQDCAPALAGTYLAGEGLYLLTLAPASVARGRAASNGLAGDAAACNSDAILRGVQFRLLEIPPPLFADLDWTEADFRNRIAYRCFGAGVLADWANELLAGGSRNDDLLTAMAGHGLSSQEVPLALIAFTAVADVAFLDADAVQRPLARPDAAGAGRFLESLAAPRRIAVGQAMLRQFARQLAELTEIGRAHV